MSLTWEGDLRKPVNVGEYVAAQPAKSELTRWTGAVTEGQSANRLSIPGAIPQLFDRCGHRPGEPFGDLRDEGERRLPKPPPVAGQLSDNDIDPQKASAPPEGRPRACTPYRNTDNRRRPDHPRQR